MPLRRIGCLALALSALAGCEPSLPSSSSSNPSTADFVVFDPATSQIPLPNDLALLPTSVAATTGAQKAILQQFQEAGGFPNDQEVPILIDVQRLDTSSGAKAPPPQGVDLTTINAVPAQGGNVLVLGPAGGAPLAPIAPANLSFKYVSGFYAPDRGTLEIHNAVADPTTGSLAWPSTSSPPGAQFIVVLRGGQSGVKLQGGGTLNAMQTMFLLTRGVDLSKPENQTAATRGAVGAQLEQLRQGFLPVFALVEQLWGSGASKEIASVQAFTIAPKVAGTAVLTDASASKAVPPVPIPSDLLLDPATNKVVNNPAFGPAAPGLATLDGFSTTGLITAGTTSPIVVATVTKDTVVLYDLSNPAQPARVKEVTEGAGAGFVAEPLQLGRTAPPASAPCTTAAGCFSTAIGLQPAVPVPSASAPGGVLALPPLKEKTEYAVLITDGVKDTTGASLKRSSLSGILLLDQPLVDANGKSQIGGQPDAVAGGLEKMRQGVAAAAAALQVEKSITKDHVVLGYTFRTQSITDVAVQLAAAPYAQAAAFVPGTPVDITTAIKAQATTLGIPTTQISQVLQVPVPTLNPIDTQTGALNPDSTKWTPAQLNALVFVPLTATGTPASPLVVFQHGLTRTRADTLGIANALATAGFVTAAIDAPLHGDRSLCTADSDCTCNGVVGSCTATCGPKAPFGGAAGTVPLGVCTNGSTIVTDTNTPSATNKSGAFFVSQNLFMTRDALRQDILDTSALILALAPTTAASNAFTSKIGTVGVAIDPSKVYWAGQSLGGILGTLNTAADPRISRAVLNVPGGTLTDVFTNSPSFTGVPAGQPPNPASPVGQLLATLGITFGTPQYLLFVNTAKWVLDPGDPLNFAAHLLGDASHPTLPNPLASNAPQSGKSVFGQFAICDSTIPNPFNLLLFGNIGLQPTTQNPFTSYAVTNGGTPPACTDQTANPHGFVLAATNQTAAGQGDLAAYLLNGTIPPASR